MIGAGSGASILDATFTNSTLQRSCGNGTSAIWLEDISDIMGNTTCVQQAMPLAFNSTIGL